MNAHLSLHSIVRIEVDNISENAGTRWREVRFVDAEGSVFGMSVIAKYGGDIKVEVAQQAQQAQECAA